MGTHEVLFWGLHEFRVLGEVTFAAKAFFVGPGIWGFPRVSRS